MGPPEECPAAGTAVPAVADHAHLLPNIATAHGARSSEPGQPITTHRVLPDARGHAQLK